MVPKRGCTLQFPGKSFENTHASAPPLEVLSLSEVLPRQWCVLVFAEDSSVQPELGTLLLA